MKVTCLSDTHGRHKYIDTRAFADTDILIHAGDFTGNGSAPQAIAFLLWFESLPVKHKVFVAGNHDRACNSSTWSELLTQYAPSCHYLYNSSVTINGYKIWGSPYSNTFGQWEFMHDDKDLAKIWRKIPADTDIVITHGPAYGNADRVEDAYGRDPYVGSVSLSNKLAKLRKLKLHVTGHIHESAGIHLGLWPTVNASICDLSYVPFNQPISVHLEDK